MDSLWILILTPKKFTRHIIFVSSSFLLQYGNLKIIFVGLWSVYHKIASNMWHVRSNFMIDGSRPHKYNFQITVVPCISVNSYFRGELSSNYNFIRAINGCLYTQELLPLLNKKLCVKKACSKNAKNLNWGLRSQRPYVPVQAPVFVCFAVQTKRLS